MNKTINQKIILLAMLISLITLTLLSISSVNAESTTERKHSIKDEYEHICNLSHIDNPDCPRQSNHIHNKTCIYTTCRGFSITKNLFELTSPVARYKNKLEFDTLVNGYVAKVKSYTDNYNPFFVLSSISILKPNTDYTISFNYTINGGYADLIIGYTAVDNSLNRLSVLLKTGVISIVNSNDVFVSYTFNSSDVPDEAKFLFFQFGCGNFQTSKVGDTVKYTNLMLNEGNTVLPYEEYLSFNQLANDYFDEGYDEGYDEGNIIGYGKGHNDGYGKGANAIKNVIPGVFGSIGDTFKRFFDLQVFGVSLGSLLALVIGIGSILLLLRLVK